MATLRKIKGQDQRTANQIIANEILSLILESAPDTFTIETVEEFLSYLKKQYKIQVRFL